MKTYQQWSVEAAWFSWSNYNMYKPNAHVKKAPKIQKSVLEKAKVHSAKSIQIWIEEIINRIRLLTNITVEDKNIMREVENLALHKDIEGFL